MKLDLRIDPEFKSVLPPLTEEEFLGLERQIITEGCRNALVVWGDVIVDGHNRYEICKKHDIEFKTIQHAFDSRDDVIVWIVDNQKDQRNLSNFAKAELALRVEPILKAKAKERMMAGKSYPVPNSAQGSQDKGKVRDELAKIAGVGHDTIERVKKIKAESDPETIEKVRKGEMSINKAYTQIRNWGGTDPVGSTNSGAPAENRKSSKEIREIVESLEDETFMDYTIVSLTDQIRINAEAFIRSLSNLLMDHADLCNGHNREIVDAIDKSITEKINQIKETFNNGTQL